MKALASVTFRQAGHSAILRTFSATGCLPSLLQTNGTIFNPSHTYVDMNPEIVLLALSISAKTSSRLCIASNIYRRTACIMDIFGFPSASGYVDPLEGLVGTSSMNGSHRPQRIRCCSTFRITLWKTCTAFAFPIGCVVILISARGV